MPWSSSTIADDRALPRRRRASRRRGWRRASAPSWITTTCTRTPCRREPRRLPLDPLRLVEEREPLGGAGAHELRRRPHGRADDADPHAVDAEDLRRLHPRRRARRSPPRRCSSTGTGSRPAPGAGGSARRRSRTRGCRRTWRPGPTRSRRRSPACPRAAPSSAARRRRCRRAASSSVRPGSAAASSSNIVASCAAPPTVDRAARRSCAVVGVELTVEVVQPDDRERRVLVAVARAGRAARRPGSARAPARRAGTPPSARGRCCARPRTVPRSIALAAGEERRPHVRVAREVLHVRHVAVLAEERRARDQRARASPRRTGTAA